MENISDIFMGAAKTLVGGPLITIFGAVAAGFHFTSPGLAMNGFDWDESCRRSDEDGEIASEGIRMIGDGARQFCNGVKGLFSPS